MFGWLRRKKESPEWKRRLDFKDAELSLLQQKHGTYGGVGSYDGLSVYQPRHPNGKFAAKKDIPLHLRDIVSFEAWCKNECNARFKSRRALVGTFHSMRSKFI